ncbi:leucine-rich repeat-containing protein 4-like [Tenebrio molitor]|jgi:hypothetical protein|uniref:leucine-rich repeat-containing protein 4-like n=1 Tax=Tenebrio molitor TaxID=7067 RepID=UPI001C3ADE7E|nr:unnamed protein product [Tenebrio molitor]
MFILNKLIFLLFAQFYTEILCACRQSYMTFCDDLTDLSSHGVEKWTELVVGPEFANASQLGTINYDTIQLDRFDKLTTLMILHQINDLRTNTFDSDPEHSKLNYLKLYGNDIKRIRESTFAAVTLSKLSLVNNNIEYIHKEAFYNCEITTIDLSDNKLEKVEKDVFTEEFLSNVTKEIIIRNNRLEWIESFSFPSSLEILNLDYNKLSTFNYNVFHNLQNLQELTMSHNTLKSLPGLKPLKEIVIIDVSHNELITLTASDFNNLSRLEVLDMSHNKIYTSMVFEKFNFPKRHPPLQISLAFNRLTHLIIGCDSFRDHIVFLYGNPWSCRCWENLEKFMVDNKVRRNECDFQFFGNGQVPYCIDQPENDCTKPFFKNITKLDLEEFTNKVKKSQKNVKCNLSPRTL